MSRMKEIHSEAQQFIHLGHEIERLEAERSALRKTLASKLREGDTVLYKGIMHEWEKYDRTSTSWKGLYTEAYRLADDEAQVILGEKERKATKKSGPFYRFKTKK